MRLSKDPHFSACLRSHIVNQTAQHDENIGDDMDDTYSLFRRKVQEKLGIYRIAKKQDAAEDPTQVGEDTDPGDSSQSESREDQCDAEMQLGMKRELSQAKNHEDQPFKLILFTMESYMIFLFISSRN